jgi:N-acetylglucosaminyldiphosphoundecaprenol N-acetyl-beta-D-mannosaminyltransferase
MLDTDHSPMPPHASARLSHARVAGNIRWPRKLDVLGVSVSATTYAEVAETLVEAAQSRTRAIVDFSPVDIIVQATRNRRFRERMNSFDLLCPDGQPVRWFLNYFHHAGLVDRVCGTTGMLRICRRAAQRGVSIYLYGSTEETLSRLQTQLLASYPDLIIAGCESPPFRPLSQAEDDAVVRRINESGAGLVFIGIGSPRQEDFAWEHRDRLQPVLLCVGAAFDFIAGTRRRAPQWMQRIGMEWLFRLGSEPGRLWKRYSSTNARFVLATIACALRGRYAVASSARVD